MMPANLRSGQCCETPGCKKPRHIGSLCAACFFTATPARRATELLTDAAQQEDRQPTVPIPSQEIAEACALEDLFDLSEGEPAELDLSGLLGEIESLPTYEGERRWRAA
jgi:hypothetical protein